MQIQTKVKKLQKKEWLYVQATGELDMAAADKFRSAVISGLLKSGCRLLWLDFARITFIDSSGLGVILGRYRQLQPLGGQVVIANANSQVYALLKAAGMHRVIHIDKPRDTPRVKEVK